MADENAQFKITITSDASSVVNETARARNALGQFVQSTKEVGEESLKAGEKGAEGAKESFLSHHQLAQMVKGLKADFPELAHMAHMALHPVTLATFGIVAAFEIWHRRVEELTVSLGGIEMPDIADEKVGRVTHMVNAWQAFNEALRQTVEASNSVSAASEKTIKHIEEEAKQKEKVLQADKTIELARLEANRSSMTEAAYDVARLQIQERYAKAGVAQEQQTRRQMLAEQERHAANLRIDAIAKEREAASIGVGSEEADKRNLAKSEKLAKAAEEELKKNEERRSFLADFTHPNTDLPGNATYFMRYGAMGIERAKALEEENRRTLEATIAYYNRELAKEPARAAARKRREELQTEAGKEMGEAQNIESELPAARSAEQRANRVSNYAAGAASLEHLSNAVAEGVKKGIALRSEAAGQVEHGYSVAPQLMGGIQSQTQLLATIGDWQRQIDRQLSELKSQMMDSRHP